MSDIALFRAAAALKVHTVFPELKKCIFNRVCFGFGKISRFFMSEHDHRYVSHYFNLPSVCVACGFT